MYSIRLQCIGFPATSINLLLVTLVYKNDDISYKNTFGAKTKQPSKSRIIPGSERMKRPVTTRFDIGIQPRLSILNT